MLQRLIKRVVFGVMEGPNNRKTVDGMARVSESSFNVPPDTYQDILRMRWNG